MEPVVSNAESVAFPDVRSVSGFVMDLLRFESKRS